MWTRHQFIWDKCGGVEKTLLEIGCALASLQHRLPVYYCYSCSSLELSPVARRSRWSSNMSTTEQQCECFYSIDLLSPFQMMCLTLLLKVRSAVWADDHSAFVASLFLLHEQRTGWSSRLGTERRWRAGGLFTIITRSRWRHADWQRPRPVRMSRSHQQHAIFGKRLHHRDTTVDCGGRDFRRNSQFVVQKQDNE